MENLQSIGNKNRTRLHEGGQEITPTSNKNSSIAEAMEELNDWGYEMTEQRLRIIEALFQVDYIENVEDFWISLRSKKKISLATVYIFLGILCRLGYVKKEPTNGKKKMVYHILKRQHIKR